MKVRELGILFITLIMGIGFFGVAAIVGNLAIYGFEFSYWGISETLVGCSILSFGCLVTLLLFTIYQMILEAS